MSMLAQVEAYLADHPWTGGQLETGDLSFYRSLGGTPYYQDAAPDALTFGAELLDQTDPGLVSFGDGAIVITAHPETLHYRPCYRIANDIVCQRVGPATIGGNGGRR